MFVEKIKVFVEATFCLICRLNNNTTYTNLLNLIAMDSGFITFLITLGVLATVFVVLYIMGKNYKHKKIKK